MKKYDYLVVGAGLFGAVFAHEAVTRGKSVLVLEKRANPGGNAYTEEQDGIRIHAYGAHIFHTDDASIWEYVQRFGAFLPYVHSPAAYFRGRLYSLPFSMRTFRQVWGVSDPTEARQIIERQRKECGVEVPRNLEEQAICLVGKDLYETLIKGYSEKQWGRPCSQLPPELIRRIPLRFTDDANYFDDPYQGIPQDGYTALVWRMLSGAEVRLETDYLAQKEVWDELADRIIYTGPIDAYYGYALGALAYRTLAFSRETITLPDFQGRAVVNYTDTETPFTRIIEHKWFTGGKSVDGRDLPYTIITKEYSREWRPGDEPYYPVNDAENTARLQAYQKLAGAESRVFFGGRLGEYRYYDMDDTITSALKLSRKLLEP